MANPKNAALGRNDLIAAYYTLSGVPALRNPARFTFAERVEAAAHAGFAAIGLDFSDYQAARAAGLSDQAMRTILHEHGIGVAELEFIFEWIDDGADGERASEAEEQLYEAADAFGARHMNVGTILQPGRLPPTEVTAGRFAALCDRAAAHGLRVALEFLPWTAIPDAGSAWEIVRRADRPNGGILVDTWHYFRGAADPAQLRAIPPERIVLIQFDDADAPVEDLLADTMRRRLPGEGSFDLVGFLRLLDKLGVNAPISVEIISPEQHARPIREAARVAYDSTRATMAQAAVHSK